MLLTLLARFSAAVNHALAFNLSRIMPYLSQLSIKCVGRRSYHLCRAGQSKALPKKLVHLAMPARGRALKRSQDCKALAAAGCCCLQPNPDAMSFMHISRGRARAGSCFAGPQGWEPSSGSELGCEQGAGLQPGSREAPGWQEGRINKERLAVCAHRLISICFFRT